MKTTKKFLAIFLALTVLFTVCSLSVFATNTTIYTILGTDNNPDDGITGIGTFEISADGHTITYGLKCIYSEVTDPICTLYAQCAVIYTDESSDCYSTYNEFVMRPNCDEEISDSFTIPSDKEVKSFSLEFQIHEHGEMYWEGYFDMD